MLNVVLLILLITGIICFQVSLEMKKKEDEQRENELLINALLMVEKREQDK